MNIGIDIKAFKNGKTGIARYLRSIMDRLQAIDTENDYFLFGCTQDDYALTNNKWKKVIVPWKLPGVAWQQFILPWQLKAHAIDVFWAPEQICPVFYRGVIFTTIHDLAALRFPASCQKSNYLIQKHLFPRCLRRSTLLLPVSDFISRETIASYSNLVKKEQFVTVTNGSPLWPYDHTVRTPANPPFLFFAGNREPRKNLGRLIDALEQLHKNGRTVRLHLAGPAGWNNTSLHDRIATSPIRDAIDFLGYLTEEELREQYRTCAAVVYPSVYEGFGIPVLEAFSLGTRVITSRGTVMEEIAGSAGRYFDPHDAADMARVIGTTLDEPSPDQIDFERYRHILDTYTWDNSARRLLDLFNRYRR
jgi:glycosyltransferase involved in cell wall biosynthesis